MAQKVNYTDQNPDKISSYFRQEKGPLTIVTISGLLYNGGMVAGPLFEGYLAQCLFDIISGTKTFNDMLQLALVYLGIIVAVQSLRYVKRFYVRRFANNINRCMKRILYNSLVHKSKAELAKESAGSLMTKAISDVDACAEGMRKFTTEIFDTGVVLIAYSVMLLIYDWRLALISGIFPPIAYYLAQKLRKPVTASAAAFKQANAQLSDITMDQVVNNLTYRLASQKENQQTVYEKQLDDYEAKAVRAGIWETAMPPLYLVISLAGVIPIIYFGSQNVLQTGWVSWNIAAFTTFLSCFNKLATKSSKAAKLFNSVQKAQVSWQRIKPLMVKPVSDTDLPAAPAVSLTARNVGFHYPDGPQIITDFNLKAVKGQTIGLTGPVASGKSTLGRLFLNEYPYQGDIEINGQPLNSFDTPALSTLVSYLGHDCELLNDTIENNVLMGDAGDCTLYLQMAGLLKEVEEMEDGIQTNIGPAGMRLSGGQQARLALARLLAHPKPVTILDDPFAAVDKPMELGIWNNMQGYLADHIVLLISHRLYLFPQFDQVIWLADAKPVVSTHEKLLATNREYAALYQMQTQEDQPHE